MRDVKSALRESLKAEQEAMQDRFEKAESVLGRDKDRKGGKKEGKIEQLKVIRDTFSFPEHDYRLIAEIQNRCLQSRIAVTKSEIVRAGLKALSTLPDTKLVQAMSTVERVKPGRHSGKV